MAGDIDRDQDMDGLLRRTLRAGDTALSVGPCLEPEQFAAWADGGLAVEDARAVELHLSTCARCQAMAAAFAKTDVDARLEATEKAARGSANVVPITAKRPIRWVLPIAAGTIAASLLVWFGTRDVRQPETQMANAGLDRSGADSTPPLVPPSRPALESRADQQFAKESKVTSNRAVPTETAKGLRDEPVIARPAAAPAPTPIAPPPPAAAPAPRQSTASGIAQSSISITLDGVSVAPSGRAGETFVAIPPVIAEFASPSVSARLDAVESANVTSQSVAVAGGGGGGGRGGGGRGGAVFRAAVAEARGAIEGTARDASGAGLPGATILAKDQSTGATSTAVTDATGGFRFSSLAPGRYSVTATLAGFVQQVAPDVVVESGGASRVNLPLAVGALSETVTVSRAAGAAGGVGGGLARDAVSKSEPAASSVTRWRIHSDNRVERSRDAGLNWQAALIDVGLPPISTGVAPSTNVCWLVGRAGLVLVTSDALTFRRAATPVNVDLLSVQATDALNATVTAADGRKFTTADGGLTWK